MRELAPLNTVVMNSAFQTKFAEYLRGVRAPRTIATYSRIAGAFLRFLASSAPSRTAVEKFLARPREDGLPRAITTRNQELASLRALAAFARRSGIWNSDPTEDVPVLREPKRNPTVLNRAELHRLFEVTAQTQDPVVRARGLAIVALLSQAGLRVHELVALDVDQVDIVSRTLLTVHGKGGTISDIPLNEETVALLTTWHDHRIERYGEKSSALFLSCRGSRLAVRSVERLFERLRKRLVTKKRITPHTLRHSAATLCLLLGADISTVGDLLRHANLNTTRRYLHLVDQRARDAVQRLGSTVPKSVLTASSQPQSHVKTPTLENLEGCMSNSLDRQWSLDDVA